MFNINISIVECEKLIVILIHLDFSEFHIKSTMQVLHHLQAYNLPYNIITYIHIRIQSLQSRPYRIIINYCKLLN